MPISKKKCNLIIDSCCDLPRALVDTLDVDFLEFPFIMDDGEHLDDFGVKMTSHQFYERMRAGESVTTTQIPLLAFTEMFTRALQSGIPTVYLAFSSGLSGSFDTAVRIAEELSLQYPEGELHVVDTLLGSVAEGLLVLEAVRQRDRGLSAEELVAWAEEARYFVHGYFTLQTLENLRRGGRIPDMAAYAGTKLDLKPILTFDTEGMLALQGATRGRKKSLKQLNELFNERAQDADKIPVIVASADDAKDADLVEERVHKSKPKSIIVRCDIGPVIGSHVGAGMVAVVFFGYDRREDISLTDRIANAVSETQEASKAAMKSFLRLDSKNNKDSKEDEL